MGWLRRLFGQDKPAPNPNNPAGATTIKQNQAIPSERVGLNGEYDESGLAKRVALAFDESPNLDDIDTLYVAQTGSTVVLKGKVPEKSLLDDMIAIAQRVDGTTTVDVNQVTIGS